jgi:hypothetical protein
MGVNDQGPGKTPANKAAREKAMVDDRRTRVASYKVRGLSLRQTIAKLAEDGCVNPKTGEPWSIGIISKDINALQARWKAEALRDIGDWIKDELERIDWTEREAREAWVRSIGEKQKRRAETTTGGKTAGRKAVVETEELNGDPRFLQVTIDCQNRRAKLLGLDAPDRHEHVAKVDVQSKSDLSGYTDEELAQFRELAARAAARAAERGGDGTTNPA